MKPNETLAELNARIQKRTKEAQMYSYLSAALAGVALILAVVSVCMGQGWF